MSLRHQRTIELFGEEDFFQISQSSVAVIGLGGVGGTALECLARTGIKRLLIMDYDLVDISNLNRQILYTSKDLGKPKTEVAKQRVFEINPEIEVITFNGYLDEESIKLFANYKIDFIIDAIDTLKAKITLQKYCLESNIPLIVCLGMGRKFSGEELVISTLDKTYNDPMARIYRTMLRKEKIDIKKIHVVFSKELPQEIKKSKPSSYIVVPSVAGCLLAGYVINALRKRGKKYDT